MKDKEFVKREKEHYGKIFIDINYGISNVSPFISDNSLERRKYVTRLPVLKKYMEAIEAAEREESKSGFFGKFTNSKYTELLEGYRNDHSEELKQLERCAKCKCLNCVAECIFEGCGGCSDNSLVASCDHKRISVCFYENHIINLTNERTGSDDKYLVLATIEDSEKDKQYIIIEGITNDEKYILYYYPGISEDSYGEITDEKEFEFIVSAYESIERK